VGVLGGGAQGEPTPARAQTEKARAKTAIARERTGMPLACKGSSRGLPGRYGSG
jgi:hypothetical protein